MGEEWRSVEKSGVVARAVERREEKRERRDSTITDDGYDTACLALIKFLDTENTSTKRDNLVPCLFFFFFFFKNLYLCNVATSNTLWLE